MDNQANAAIGGANQESTSASAATGQTAPAPKHENILEEIGHGIETGIVDIGKFVGDLPKVIKAWNALEPRVKAAASQVFHDIFTQLVPDVAADMNDVKTLNIPGSIAMSEQTWSALKQLYTDARSGEEAIVASLKVLGISI